MHTRMSILMAERGMLQGDPQFGGIVRGILGGIRQIPRLIRGARGIIQRIPRPPVRPPPVIPPRPGVPRVPGVPRLPPRPGARPPARAPTTRFPLPLPFPFPRGAPGEERAPRRRINVGNIKALRRSMRRVQGFAKLCKKTISFTTRVKMKKRRRVC